jgi:nucleotide-binding universal stress UspA family protein
VPVDFSDNSKKILQAAVTLAGKLNAKLSVVFVVQSFEDYSGFFVPHMPISKFEEEMISSAEAKMKTFAAEVVPAGMLSQATVKVGDVAEEILRFAEEAGSDLIVMGTHGYKGLERILFGSVAEQVVKTSSCPVLTINPYR